MRDRLIELITNLANSEEPMVEGLEFWADAIADYLIEKGVIVPPCKVWQTVYVLTHDSPTGIEKSMVKRMLLQELQDGTTIKIIVPCVFDDWGNAVREFYPNDFGKTIFLTREQAEKALAEVTNAQH